MSAKAVFELDAEVRLERGKGASRRLRRLQGRIPAIIYGGNQPPVALTLEHKKVQHALENKAFYSHILTLRFKESLEQVVLKDLQRHHFKKAISHMDFQRVSATEAMNLRVPLRFVGEATCPAIKAGGMVHHHFMEVEVRCLASLLPEYIEVDLSHMAMDQILHLSDLSLPKGVHLVNLSHGNTADHNHAVVSIHMPRQKAEPEATTEVKETEVISKAKEPTATAAAKEAAPKSGGKDKGK
jgi:large subunit ribosomal protein L25